MPLPHPQPGPVLLTSELAGADGDTVTLSLESVPGLSIFGGTHVYKAEFGFRTSSPDDPEAVWTYETTGIEGIATPLVLGEFTDQLVTIQPGATLTAKCEGSAFTITWYVVLVPVSIIVVPGS